MPVSGGVFVEWMYLTVVDGMNGGDVTSERLHAECSHCVADMAEHRRSKLILHFSASLSFGVIITMRTHPDVTLHAVRQLGRSVTLSLSERTHMTGYCEDVRFRDGDFNEVRHSKGSHQPESDRKTVKSSCRRQSWSPANCNEVTAISLR